MFSSSSFAIALLSNDYPLTRNNTVYCKLYSSHTIDNLSVDMFMVRNGHILEVSTIPQPEENNYVSYQVIVQATVQGSFCIDVAQGILFDFTMIIVGTAFSSEVNAWNVVQASLCLQHGFYFFSFFLINRFFISLSSFFFSFLSCY